VKLGTFRAIRATTAKKCTKKRDARAKLLLCLSKSFYFSVLVAVAALLLKLLKGGGLGREN